MSILPKPIRVQIIYDKKLQEITGVEKEEATVSEGLIFVLFLKFIFDSYPKICQLYPAGSLGMLLNGRPPTEFDILNDGDEIRLIASYSVN